MFFVVQITAKPFLSGHTIGQVSKCLWINLITNELQQIR